MSLPSASSSIKASRKCQSPKPTRKSPIYDGKSCRIYISAESAETVYELHKKLGHRTVGETIRWLLAQIKSTVDFTSDHPLSMATSDSQNNAPLIGQQMQDNVSQATPGFQNNAPLMGQQMSGNVSPATHNFLNNVSIMGQQMPGNISQGTLGFNNNAPLMGQQLSETLPSIHGGPSFDQFLNEINHLSFPPLFDNATYFSSLPSIFNTDEASLGTSEFGFMNKNLTLPPILDAEGRFSTNSMSVFPAGETFPPSFDAKSFQLENDCAFNYNNKNVPLVPSDAPLSVFGTAGETSRSADAS